MGWKSKPGRPQQLKLNVHGFQSQDFLAVATMQVGEYDANVSKKVIQNLLRGLEDFLFTDYGSTVSHPILCLTPF
ncbi:hypothetical protein TorRG33x02_164480 [Trema orientale]|uniref:Uncharacterized protein n=1 Tax=Trema orientale TaxID=63057 RepID=A0A2P5EQB6_TREOI|nr:hypothetical protein TorRG33x02_164480 [Trema orientale]